MERFLSLLQGHSVKREQEDRMVWKGESKGVFFVKVFYSLLETGGSIIFPLKIVWNPWIPSKVSFFTQEVCWGKVLTLDELQRRGCILACALCKEELESVDHILLHFDKARLLWQLVFSVFGVQWVISESVRETLLGWHGSFIERRHIKAWGAAPCIFWMTWKERNDRYFDGEELSNQRLKSLFLNSFSMWVRVYIGGGYTHLINCIEWLGIG